MRLYHFTGPDHALSNLRQRHLKLARINDLNDPFELLAPDLPDRAARDRLRKFKSDTHNRIGLLCFCDNWANPVMWSHYAAKHRGYCFGFDIADANITKITYSPKRPILSFKRPPTNADLDKLLFVKSEGWGYEQEFRIVSPLRDAKLLNGMYFERFSDQVRLREVIVGPTCDVTEREIRTITDNYPEDERIKIIKARLAFRSFKVVKNRMGFSPKR